MSPPDFLVSAADGLWRSAVAWRNETRWFISPEARKLRDAVDEWKAAYIASAAINLASGSAPYGT